jgi:hypothetical protein
VVVHATARTNFGAKTNTHHKSHQQQATNEKENIVLTFTE